MVEYGCEPYQALKSATYTAAHALGMEQDLGSLEVGKKADMVILNKNPLENISTIRAFHYVIKGGEILRSKNEATD